MRVVGVVAELRRQVERDREAGLPAVEQVAVTRVRLLRRGEAGVLADRPRAPAVHVAVRAARVRILAGKLELGLRVLRRVDGLDLDPGLVLAPVGRRHRPKYARGVRVAARVLALVSVVCASSSRAAPPDSPPASRPDESPQWSRDGRSLLFVRERNGYGRLMLWRSRPVLGPIAALGYSIGDDGHRGRAVSWSAA